MTELEKIERRLDDLSSQMPEHDSGWHSAAVDRKLLHEAHRLLDICKEQNAMLCRFAQDHEAYNQGKADLARDILGHSEIGGTVIEDGFGEWLKDRITPTSLVPDYEETLDKLWEAKKTAKLLDDWIRATAGGLAIAPMGQYERDVLVRLLNLLTS